MSAPLFFLDEDFNGTALRDALADGSNVICRFSHDESKHMAALRIHAGEHVVVSDGNGLAMEVELLDDPKKGENATVNVNPVSEAPMPYRPNLTLVQGVSKGERMDLLTRQSVELGVRRIIPAMTARCIVKLDAQKRKSRGERWRKVALSAAKQSGQPVVPQICDPIDFADAVKLAGEEADAVVIPWEESRDGSIADVLHGMPASTRVFLFIGPEGGFEKSEVDSVVAIGGKVVSLGDTILRTETAGVIASALAIYELGGLGNRRADA